MAIIQRNSNDDKGSNATKIVVPADDVSTLILPANESRKMFSLVNFSKKKLYLSFTSKAEEEQGILIEEKDLYENQVYKGNVYGIWSGSSNEGAVVFEITT